MSVISDPQGVSDLGKDSDFLKTVRSFAQGFLQWIGQEEGEKEHAEDAKPQTLYVSRSLKSADALIAWAKEQGFKTTLDPKDMHATVAFSRTPVDWDKFGTAPASVKSGAGNREVKPLGDKGAVVLVFECADLSARWKQFTDGGASWDHDGYHPHVTLTYDGAGVDLSKIKPFDGDLVFGPEVFAPVDDDWNKKITEVKAMDGLAFDRATVRRKDQDGHLFVEITPISKANICPYMGHEIPDFEKLGLVADKQYRLLRDPEELKKAAPSFGGKPLMLIHKPINAADHPREVVVGSVSNDVEFKAPYLMAGLNIWDGEAIALIESDEQKELSSAYRYRPDMTAGTFEGEPYDGVMRDLIGNHVAMVKSGRAGSDVVVGDSAIKPKPSISFGAFSVPEISFKAFHGA